MQTRPYIKITSGTESFTFGMVLVALLVGIVPFLLHMQVVDDTHAQNAAGPCFAFITGNSSIDDIKNPEKYSGYSTIVDTVRTEYTPSGDVIPKKEEKPQIMMINGKEYILK